MLRVNTRVADLYNQPMNQTEEQLRLTIEALRERQEHELINNREFGLLHNADLKQRIYTRSGPPPPTTLMNWSPAGGSRGSSWPTPGPSRPSVASATAGASIQTSIDMDGSKVITWRNVPILPCNKIPITKNQTSSILVMRTGEETRA